MADAEKGTFSFPGKVHGGPTSILKNIDQIEKLIGEIPREHLSDVQAAIDQIFRDRLEESASTSETEEVPDAGDASRRPAKKPRKKNEMEDLKAIQIWLRDKVPVEAVLPSETILYNRDGEFKEYTAENTVSVDGFLYEEEDIDELCDAGKLCRNMCSECGSRKVQPLNFISHSLSIAEMNFIFKQALPNVYKGNLKDKTVLDVGSRLGGVVYAAVLLGGCRKAIGIEMNEDLCRLQERVLSTFDLAGRAQIVCADVATQREVLGEADVIVLHNTFQFFLTPATAAAAWLVIRESIKAGCIIVACPSLEEQLSTCADPTLTKADHDTTTTGGKGRASGKAKHKSGPKPVGWAERLAVTYPMAEDDDDEHADEEGRLYTSLHFYRAKGRAASQ